MPNSDNLLERDEEISHFLKKIDDLINPNSDFFAKPTLWHGAPGTGATALRQRFESELIERVRKKQPYAFATLHVGTNANVIEMLLSIRGQLAKFCKLDLFAFDWAFIRMFRLANPDKDIRTQHPNLFTGSGATGADKILDWLDLAGREWVGLAEEGLSLVPGLKLLSDTVRGAGKFVSERVQQKHNKETIEQLVQLGEEDLRNQLPDLLSLSIQRLIEERGDSGSPLGVVLLIDGYENLHSIGDEHLHATRWLTSLDLSERVFIAAFGRSPDRSLHHVTFEGRALLPLQSGTVYQEAIANGLPQYAADILVQFAQGNPSAMHLGIREYNALKDRLESQELAVWDTETWKIQEGNNAARSIMFRTMLESEVCQKLYFRLTRNMNIIALRETIFLCCMDSIGDNRLRQSATYVLGQSLLDDTSRARRQGIIFEGSPPDWEGSRVMPLFRKAVLHSSLDHINISLEIKRRSAVWLLGQAEKSLLEQVDVGLSLLDVDLAFDLVGFWDARTFEALDSLVDVLLETDNAVALYMLGEDLQSLVDKPLVDKDLLLTKANQIKYFAAEKLARHELASSLAKKLATDDGIPQETTKGWWNRFIENSLAYGATKQANDALLMRLVGFQTEIQSCFENMLNLERETENAPVQQPGATLLNTLETLAGPEARSLVDFFLDTRPSSISDVFAAARALRVVEEVLKKDISLTAGNYRDRRVLLTSFSLACEKLDALLLDFWDFSRQALRYGCVPEILSESCHAILQLELTRTEEYEGPVQAIGFVAAWSTIEQEDREQLARDLLWGLVDEETSVSKKIALLQLLAPHSECSSEERQLFLRSCLKLENQIANLGFADDEYTDHALIERFMVTYANVLLSNDAPLEAIQGKIERAVLHHNLSNRFQRNDELSGNNEDRDRLIDIGCRAGLRLGIVEE